MALQVRSENHVYGWQPSSAEWRAKAPPLERYLKAMVHQDWQPGMTLDQDNVGACGPSSATHDLNCTPIAHVFDSAFAIQMYWDICEANGRNHNDQGITYEELVAWLQHLGFLNQYAFTQSIDTVKAFVDSQSGVLQGTLWYPSMDTPNEDGLITVDFRGVPAGHSVFRMANIVHNGEDCGMYQQSWGLQFGIPFRGIPGGFFIMRDADSNKLVNLPGDKAGEFLAFVEVSTPVPVPTPPGPGCWPVVVDGFNDILTKLRVLQKQKPTSDLKVVIAMFEAAVKAGKAKAK